MVHKDREPKGRWHLSMGFLRWLTIVGPVVFLASLDVLRHTVFVKLLHSLPAFVGTYAIIALAVSLFSHAIFGLIGRLQQHIMDQNRYLSALNEIAKAAAGKLELTELLDIGLDHILRTMKVDAGLICLVDREREEHSAISSKNFSTELIRQIQRAKLRDDPVAYEVVHGGRPVVLERLLEDPRVAEAASREGVRSALSAPLKAEGEVNGILVIATRQERHFSDADQELLEAIGGQLGIVIRNAVLYEQSELQNRELSALLAVGKVVTSSFDLNELLRQSLDTIIEVLPADAAEVWLMEGSEELNLRCHRGSHREAFLEQTRFRVGQGIPGLLAVRQEPIVVHDLPSQAAFLRQGIIKAGFRTFAALPLRYQSELVGVLAVAAVSAEALQGPRELRLLEGVGEWLAIAIENARLHQQVQDVAVLQERERIAREMHDGMAQLLGYINTETIAVRKLLDNAQLTDACAELVKMEEITRDLYADVREGILGLRLSARRHEDLLPALREYAEQYMDMSGIEVEFEVTAEAERLRLVPSAEIQLMRILQEALTNVRKHAQATAVRITFERNGRVLQATVADNGRGFERTRLPSTGWPRFGFQTMRERAEAIGGSLEIDTTPGQGTRVCVSVPLSPQED